MKTKYAARDLVEGGQAMPLSLLPDWVQTIAWLSPFRWILASPTELLIGRLTPAETLAGLGMQLLWTAVSGSPRCARRCQTLTTGGDDRCTRPICSRARHVPRS